MGRPRNIRSRRWAEKIREKRLFMGWTQPELAERVGRSSRYIQRIESTHIVPPAADRLRLEKELEITSSQSAELRGVRVGRANISRSIINVMRHDSDHADTGNATVVVYPQKVSWGPANGLPAGIQVWSAQTEFSIEEALIPWQALRLELTRIILPWILVDPVGYQLITKEYRGKPEWLVWLIDRSENWFCDVWFGGDPDRNWDFDGLIRFGDANGKPRAWITFQRYSDGTYRKRHSLGETLDDIKRSDHHTD